MLLISIIGAILPAWWLVNYFTKADRFPEPTAKIKQTFFGGVTSTFWVLLVAVPILLFVEQLEGVSIIQMSFLQAFLCAAIPEEFFKFKVLKKISQDKEFDEPMDGIVYGAVASLGFATLENILYCIDGGLGAVIGRAFTAVPAHASFGALMGYYYSKNHFAGRANGLMSKAMIVPVLAHGFYDFDLFVIVGISSSIGEADLSDDQALIVGMCFLSFLILGGWMFIKVKAIVREMQMEQDALIVTDLSN